MSALIAGACDLLHQKTGHTSDLWSCLLLFYETVEGVKQWIVDPSFEECCNISNNLILVTKAGTKFSLQVGAEINRTSFSVQNSANLNFKSSAIGYADLSQGFKIAQAICTRALGQFSQVNATNDYELRL